MGIIAEWICLHGVDDGGWFDVFMWVVRCGDKGTNGLEYVETLCPTSCLVGENTVDRLHIADGLVW